MELWEPGTKSLSTLTEGLSAWRLITLLSFLARLSMSTPLVFGTLFLPRSFALFPASGTELTQGEQACFTVPAGLARCLLSHRS